MTFLGYVFSVIFGLFAIPWMRAHQAALQWNFPGRNIGVGCHLLFQGIFLTPGSNLSLLSLLHWQVDFFFFFLPLHHLGIPNFSRASVKRREFRESTLYTTCIFIINVCFDQRSYPQLRQTKPAFRVKMTWIENQVHQVIE